MCRIARRAATAGPRPGFSARHPRGRHTPPTQEVILLSTAIVALTTNPPALHAGTIALVSLSIVGVLVLVVAGLTLYWLARQQAFFTWFMLHLAIGILGILAVVILAVEGVLDAAAAAILSSIVAYSVGASGSRSNAAAAPLAQVSPTAIQAVLPLPGAQRDAPYRAQPVKLPGQTPPYHLGWTPAAGSALPPGLQFDGDSGVLSGTPQQAGTYRFTIQTTGTPTPAVLGTFELAVSA